MKNSNGDVRLIGKKFGRLTIISFEVDVVHRNTWKWRVLCECGNEKVCLPSDVKGGKIMSCGCLLRERSAEKARKFEHAVGEHKRLYNIYNKMKARCTNANEARYSDYGGRGISVCDEWAKSFDSFAEWALNNGYDDGLTLERVDVNGNYCPENCAWITLSEQTRNKRNTVYAEYNGEAVSLKDLAGVASVSYDTLYNRLKHGWKVETAVETPSARESKTLLQMSKANGLKYATVLNRVNRLGWSVEKALSTPIRGSSTLNLR